MVAGGLWVALGLRRFFLTLSVITLAVMFGGRPVALRGGFVMLSSLGMRFLSHVSSHWFELRWLLNASGWSSFRTSTDSLLGNWSVSHKALRLSEHDGRFRSCGATAKRQENIMLNWAIAFLIIALIAGLLGFGVVAGTAFAAAKVIFVIALLAFLVSAVVEVSRRGVP
jgi:uncharacterized membrane protein YtjA (UPF0391 family)